MAKSPPEDPREAGPRTPRRVCDLARPDRLRVCFGGAMAGAGQVLATRLVNDVGGSVSGRGRPQRPLGRGCERADGGRNRSPAGHKPTAWCPGLRGAGGRRAGVRAVGRWCLPGRPRPSALRAGRPAPVRDPRLYLHGIQAPNQRPDGIAQRTQRRPVDATHPRSALNRPTPLPAASAGSAVRLGRGTLRIRPAGATARAGWECS
jgi:hypothetical protein